LVPTYLRENDFATIKILGRKIVDENFWFIPISEEMIFQPYKFTGKNFL